MPAAAQIDTGTVILDRYVVGKPLGHGGMGSVYEATHRLTGKRVAVKCLRPELAEEEVVRKRLLREAQIAARVEHPNTVDIYDVGVHEGAIFLVMELLRGTTLSDWMEKNSAPPVQELLALMMPALRGLAAMHKAGVVHRDLKPHNVFLCEGTDGSIREAKVLDFGIATDSDSFTAGLTQPGQVLGTPAYMAPEQLHGKGVLDHRVDVYAVGVIIYEGLTGKRPFDGQNVPSIVQKILYEEPVPLEKLRPDVPVKLSRIVMRAMARERDDRFPDVPTLAEALAEFAGVAAGMTPTLMRSAIPPRRRPIWPLLLGATLVLALGAFLLKPLFVRDADPQVERAAEPPSATGVEEVARPQSPAEIESEPRQPEPSAPAVAAEPAPGEQPSASRTRVVRAPTKREPENPPPAPPPVEPPADRSKIRLDRDQF